ncbi:MAG: efflux RND transporter permease subunit, partial [Polyangiaceae bacterium]|nr:efflux RND transporter permease subunit [Polyangiaceae bacterium]
LEAIALVLLVLLLTLANLRAGFVVALVIPLALVGIFIGMWIGGVHGNLISLGAIDFGLVVDGAIIIVENALHRLGEKHALLGRPLTAQEHEETVFEAAKEVRKATAFGEAIIALVYVPILVLTGVEGRTFRPMAMTVLFALGSAFVLSLTLVPALSVYLLPKNLVAHESSLLAFVRKYYEPLLARALRVPKAVFAITLIFFAGTLGAAQTLGSEFLPKLDEGTLIITMVRLPSVSLDQAIAQDVLVAKTLKQFPEVTDIVARTGRAEVAIDAMAVNMTDTYVFLKPRSDWTTRKSRDELIDTFDKALRDSVPGAGFSYTQPIEMNTNDLLAGIHSDVAVHLYGYDPVQLRLTSDKILRRLKEIPGAKDVHAEQIAGSTTLNLNIDRVAVGRAGIDASRVLDAVSAIGGVRVVDVLYKNVPTAIQVRFSKATRADRESVLSVPVKTNTGMIPLGQLVRAEEVPSPSQFSHERLSRRLTVQLNVRGRDVASFVEEAKLAIDKDVKLPTGFFLAWAGEYERLQAAKSQLAIVVPVALTLILVLLMLTFGSMRPALLIFANVPVAISGGILALVARGITFSISAAVGFIALFGIAVLNGLVLVSALERLRDEGHPIASVVHDGAVRRLRPVLTTALVASLGFLPMAIADGAGAEVQRPLATVVIGGILTSTILTLIVLPVAYAWMWRKKSAAQGVHTPD